MLKNEESFIFKHNINDPKITAEKHRIDALIIDTDFAVIIENKIHGAIDQPEQIQRYINAVNQYKITENNIFIIYMTREGDAPSEDSFPKLLQDKFKSRFKQISYRQDIIEWLIKEVIPLCKMKEDFLNSALLQYIDHLEGMFHLRTIDKPMRTELTKHLEEILKLDDNSSRNVRVISEKLEDIDTIKSFLEDLRLSNYFKSWANHIKTDFPGYKVIEEFDNLDIFPKVGIEMNFRGIPFHLLIEKEKNLYFGIASSKSDRNVLITTFVNELFPNNNTSEYKWYYWKYTEYEKAYQDFKLLVDMIISKHNNSH